VIIPLAQLKLIDYNHPVKAVHFLRILVLLLISIAFLFQHGSVLADPLPDSAVIEKFRGAAQRFTLSCESRSAVDLAAYWGVEIREKRFLNTLPRSDNPETGFVGNPNGAWGNVPPMAYGVHAEPVAETLQAFGLEARAWRGLSWDDLRIEIAAGRPVIVWVIGQMWRGSPMQYRARDGSMTTVAAFEHTMVLYGYEPNRVYVQDAYSGYKQTYSVRAFLASWRTLGRMAVTVYGAIEPEPTITPTVSPALIRNNPPAEGPVLLGVKRYLPLVFGPQTLISVAPLELDTPAVVETYTVKRGDYLVAVARKFNLNWIELAMRNGIRYPYRIRPGQVLRLR
jgi:uncharacterized protein YvpB